MSRNGWQNLDSIMDGLFGAAGVAAIAGASEVLGAKKQALKAAAPVGKTKKTVHFADPIIAGGRIRQGGRTQSSINFASPDIDIIKFGDLGFINVTAELVMAPQGFYQDGRPSIRRITPTNRTKLGWIGRNGFGIWAKSTRSHVGGQNQGWIAAALRGRIVVDSRLQSTFRRQFTAGGNIRILPVGIRDSAFVDKSRTGAWFDAASPRANQKDLAWRRAMQARSRRASLSWDNATARAVRRLN